MSSLGLNSPSDPTLYHWSDNLNEADYLRAVYEITTTRDGLASAVSMAMEQSVGTTHIHNYLNNAKFASSCIRVCSVQQIVKESNDVVTPFILQTPVYGEHEECRGSFVVELAVPLCLLEGKPAQLLNILVGELPRLGFLTRFCLVKTSLPVNFGPGPAFGIPGIRQLTGQMYGPLLCRSMRPAVGLDTGTMAQLNHDVLVGGFHIVKDDELQVFATFASFEKHIRAMIDARDNASRQTREKKLYFANLICEPWELIERWELCCQLGVDGVLVAPWIQGLGTLSYLANQKRMPILAHNTLGELFSRHPDWKISETVLTQWLRALGADMFVTNGNFGHAPAAAVNEEHDLWPALETYGTHPAMLPILQGGKNPEELPQYLEAVGSADFMLIVASWVDNHPAGFVEGAKLFRQAIIEKI